MRSVTVVNPRGVGAMNPTAGSGVNRVREPERCSPPATAGTRRNGRRSRQ